MMPYPYIPPVPCSHITRLGSTMCATTGVVQVCQSMTAGKVTQFFHR